MTHQTLKAVRAILDTDPTISEEDRNTIIRVCKKPEVVQVPQLSPIRRMLNSGEVAEILGVTTRTVWRMVERKQLHPIKLSRRVTRFRAGDLESLLPLETEDGAHHQA